MFSTIEQIKDANQAAGYKFFAPDTLRFFRSRVSSEVYGGRYFITSEKAGSGSTIRAYTVRRANDDGTITTVSGFLQFPTAYRAKTFARRLAAGKEEA
jgi:hypothetical protein